MLQGNTIVLSLLTSPMAKKPSLQTARVEIQYIIIYAFYTDTSSFGWVGMESDPDNITIHLQHYIKTVRVTVLS